MRSYWLYQTPSNNTLNTNKLFHLRQYYSICKIHYLQCNENVYHYSLFHNLTIVYRTFKSIKTFLELRPFKISLLSNICFDLIWVPLTCVPGIGGLPLFLPHDHATLSPRYHPVISSPAARSPLSFRSSCKGWRCEITTRTYIPVKAPGQLVLRTLR